MEPEHLALDRDYATELYERLSADESADIDATQFAYHRGDEDAHKVSVILKAETVERLKSGQLTADDRTDIREALLLGLGGV